MIDNPIELLESFIKFLNDEHGIVLFVVEDGDVVHPTIAVELVDEFVTEYYRKKST